MEIATKHLNVKIFGRVQGVSFRWQTQKKAKSFGFAGFVRNEPDGTVYIEAEGEDAQVTKFLDWCRKGPLFAKVENVEFEEAAVKGYTTFEIKT